MNTQKEGVEKMMSQLTAIKVVVDELEALIEAGETAPEVEEAFLALQKARRQMYRVLYNLKS